jgi:DNA (cytosine-5)-methyltransferase 1
MAFEEAGFRVVFANDNNETKRSIYALNFGGGKEYRCADIQKLHGTDIPDIEIAAASFPCTDLSVAGNRAGLEGKESSLFFEFVRILREMGSRRPPLATIENVVGFAMSNSGYDLRDAIAALNGLGYVCDLIALDARRFVPQSRPRLFIVGAEPGMITPVDWRVSEVRPRRVVEFAARFPELRVQAAPLPQPPFESGQTIQGIVEPITPEDGRWWSGSELRKFVDSLSAINSRRMHAMQIAPTLSHRTAYRRTRGGHPVWEIREDAISGCLRTSRGGSSRQAVVEAGQGQARVRWMTAREYARLQGASDLCWGDATEAQAKFALGDAVCVPAVSWLAREYLGPVIHNRLRQHIGA